MFMKTHFAGLQIVGCQTSSSDDDTTNSEVEEKDEYKPYFAKIPKMNVLNKRVLSVLDARKISDNDAVHVISAVMIALGYSIDELNLSRSTLSRARTKNRKNIANETKISFKVKIIVIIIMKNEVGI